MPCFFDLLTRCNVNQNARAKTTAIRQTLDAIGADLSHEVVDGTVKIETAETITLVISDKSGSELFRVNTKILKKEVS